MLGVINGVLDLSKIEAGKVEIEHSAFDLRIVVEEVTELFSELAYGKGLELACFVPANLPTALIGDAGRLRQILTNLIGNAVKFTERGEVGVRAYAMERDAASVLIAFEVVDTGIGIPAEKRRHIFEAFAQADSSTTRRYGGTGLGLSIAKHFCEMMGGSIDVASEPGAGSKFRFTARFGVQPLAAEQNTAPCAAPSRKTGPGRRRQCPQPGDIGRSAVSWECSGASTPRPAQRPCSALRTVPFARSRSSW